MVECTGLENRRTERYRGFESLSLRTESCKSKDLQDFSFYNISSLSISKSSIANIFKFDN